jgi:hypothetical protein
MNDQAHSEISEWEMPITVHYFSNGTTAPSGPGLPHYRGFTITHTRARHQVGLLWTSDQPDVKTSTC